jgi:hypothetical protein
MADLLQQGDGVVRHADTVMRTAGGRAVLLRLASPAVPGDEAEQLGLATPGFQDVELAPAVFHKANNVHKLVISASAVAAVVGSLEFDSAEVLFETAVGVVIDEVVYEITNSFSSQAMGVAYCYWLELQLPVR